MPALPQVTAAALARRARDLLRDAAELTSGRDPNYIRDAQPDSVFEAIPLAAARQGCRRYADKPEQYSGRRQARVERACRPYLDSIGYGEQPSIEVPFRGGQCSDVYTVNYTLNPDNAGSTTGFLQARGPIAGIRREQAQTGSWITTLGCHGLVLSGSPNCRQIAEQGFAYRNIGGAKAPADGPGPRINSITPCGLDNCGSPPPDITYPVPPTPGPVREPFVRVPDIDVDIDIEVNPDLTIDVDFGTGPITIDPFGDEGGGGGAGEPGTPGSPSDTGAGGDAEGEAPEGQVLTGLRIDFVEPPIGGNEYAPGVFRAVCYIYMGTAEGLDHDPAGAMLRSGQFVYAEKDFLTRWAVSANAGYNLRVTPYYSPLEGEE